MTRAQVLARRNAWWLHAYEVGPIDLATGQTVRQSMSLIALMAGVSRQAVRKGIAAARRHRDQVQRGVE